MLEAPSKSCIWWGSFTPFYNLYLWYEITLGNGWLAFTLLVPIVGLVFAIMALIELARSFGVPTYLVLATVFFSNIMVYVYGFGNLKYIGNKKERKAGFVPNRSTGESSSYASSNDGFSKDDFRSYTNMKDEDDIGQYKRRAGRDFPGDAFEKEPRYRETSRSYSGRGEYDMPSSGGSDRDIYSGISDEPVRKTRTSFVRDTGEDYYRGDVSGITGGNSEIENPFENSRKRTKNRNTEIDMGRNRYLDNYSYDDDSETQLLREEPAEGKKMNFKNRFGK